MHLRAQLLLGTKSSGYSTPRIKKATTGNGDSIALVTHDYCMLIPGRLERSTTEYDRLTPQAVPRCMDLTMFIGQLRMCREEAKGERFMRSASRSNKVVVAIRWYCCDDSDSLICKTIVPILRYSHAKAYFRS